jgi:hypothetical protein
MGAALLIVGVGAGIALLAAALDAGWLIIFALLAAVIGGVFFFMDMQNT